MAPALLIAALLTLAAEMPAPLSGAEVALLLEIGVAEPDILACAARCGGIEALDAAAYGAVLARNPSVAFLDGLPRATPEFGTLSELARASDVFQDPRLRLAFVHPSGWTVTRAQAGGGGVLLRIAPRSEAEPRVFITPSIFVFVLESVPMVEDAVDPVLARIRDAIEDRVRDAGLRTFAGSPTRLTLFGRPKSTVAIEASAGGSAGGVLELVFDLDPLGRIVGAGYTAGPGDRAGLAEAFSRLVRSIALR